ncbi:hypothetical protein MN116_003110 [Schistosoma mekongi]|uniref:Uncharacterized protein n=1 Tax=Schistosoma mekongi TaxID=38744 RepID=A0AAE2D716_SCHME|nr:hypothetical protein MN116_003110 [Schistosoma mekongi]
MENAWVIMFSYGLQYNEAKISRVGQLYIRKSRRRRSCVELLDLTNSIESPPLNSDSNYNLRESKRLRRNSICPSNSEGTSYKALPKPSRIGRRKSLRCPLKQLNSHNYALTTSTQPSSNITQDLPLMDISAHDGYAIFFDNLSISSPNKFENTKQSSQSPPIIPITVADVYLSKKYIPPSHKGLATVIENPAERNQRRPRLCKKAEHSPIRRQIFTGQTLEEACAPTAPGIAPLDPDLVLSTTRKRVTKRQKLAKKLGFRGISISKQTEENFTRFMSQSNLNSSRSSSASV